MIVVAVGFLLLTASVLTSLSVVGSRVKDTRVDRNLMVARLAAQSGVERQIGDLKEIRDLASMGSPFETVDSIDTNSSTGVGGYSVTITDGALSDFEGEKLAEYDVLIDVQATGENVRRVMITCYAYVPDKAAYLSGDTDAVRADAHAVTEVALKGSEVFDYSYFINHWGWFYGNTIVSNGNARSNGQFDFGGYGATVNGSPRYESSDGTDLIGYLDDNGDGVEDGSDGGVYSGMGIAGEQNVRGMGGEEENQHSLESSVPMPNLSDLSWYESSATEQNGSIRIGGTTHVSGVLGDDAGESQHLFLVGTAANPIVIDGPVVVRGSVVISGVVTGQGSIYSGGNVYVPANVEYANAPATPRPVSNDQATVEAWRAAAAGRDSLGLFAREHVVIGDYTHSWWQGNVSGWVAHHLNESREDAGIDGIQNTRAGVDGVLGTADDDVLEGDGEWTVSRYTDADDDAGLIPQGLSVGDVIPGSGEDIDGDGVFDDTTQMSEFSLPVALDPSNWAGNLSESYSSFSQVSTIYISHVDAALYTNHTLAALMINWSGDIEMNGSIVSRNDAIIYGAHHIQMNHDERLTGGGTSTTGFGSAVSWEPIRKVQWEFDKSLPAEVLGDPAQIAEHYTGVEGGAS